VINPRSEGAWEKVKDDPRWVGVHSLTMGWSMSLGDIRKLFTARWLGGLKRLRGINPTWLSQLAEEQTLPLKTLGLTQTGSPKLEQLLATTAFDGLEHLEYGTWEGRELETSRQHWLWRCPWVYKVKTLIIKVPPNQEAPIQCATQIVTSQPSQIIRLEFWTWQNQKIRELVREPGGEWPDWQLQIRKRPRYYSCILDTLCVAGRFLRFLLLPVPPKSKKATRKVYLLRM
jgi:hypothetical protein